MPNNIDRRRQPQNTLKVIKEVLLEMNWPIKEMTSQRFVSPSGKWQNESFGYLLNIPKDLSYIRKFWVGYLKHKDVTPPGIYAGMNPIPTKEGFVPLRAGYRLSPFDAFILLKPIIPQKQLEEMEKQFGTSELKKKIKQIMIKTYPFSLK